MDNEEYKMNRDEIYTKRYGFWSDHGFFWCHVVPWLFIAGVAYVIIRLIK